MTLVETLKVREEETRNAVLKLLHYSEEDLSFFIFEGAYEYLQQVFGTDAYGLTHLPKTHQFWSWWKKEWAKIDAVFIASVEQAGRKIQFWEVRDRDHDFRRVACADVEQLRRQYHKYHEAHMSNRYLNSDVVRAGAYQMINDIIATQKQALATDGQNI